MKHTRILFLLPILLGLGSCIKKEFKDVEGVDLNLSMEFGLPIAKGDLSFSGVFEPGEDSSMFITPGNDGILHFMFKQNIDTLKIDELMSDLMGSQLLLNDSITLPKVSNGVSINSPETNFNLHLDSLLQNQQLDSLMLNSGVIEFEFKTWRNYDSEFSITLPNLTDAQGNVIQMLNFVPAADNYKMSINLANSKLKINTSKTTKGIFTVKLGYDIMGKTTGQNIPEPVIGFTMYNFDIRSAYGKLGGFALDLDPISIDLFDENPLGEQIVELDLGEPQINLLFLNQFGFPFSVSFSQMGFMNDGIYEGITGVPDSIMIQAPPLGSENEFTTAVFKIDPNSNLDKLVSKFPQKMIIDGTMKINPEDANGYNYIREEDMLVARVEADIPLSFSLSQISLNDTALLNLSSLEQIQDNLDLFRLNSKISNGFPFELRLQAYFADENMTIMDSLFSEPVYVRGAQTDNEPSVSNFWIDKSNSQIRTLKNSKHMIAEASISTRGGDLGEIVGFYNNESLQLEITGFAKINL